MTATQETSAVTATEPEWRAVVPPRIPLRAKGDGSGFQVAVRWPTADCDGATLADRAEQERFARQVERIGLDYIAISEPSSGAGGPESDAAWPAALQAVRAALATRTIGVVSAQRTSYVHPVHLARIGAHLDWLSGGRWGAWIDPTRTDAEDRLHGRTSEWWVALERAEAAMDAVSAIWRTPSGTEVDVDNAHFKIHGRVKYPVPIQREPFVLISEPGIESLRLAASVADQYVAPAASVAELVTVAGQAQEAAQKASRTTPFRVMADVVIGPAPAEPEGRLALQGDTAQLGIALGQLADLADVGGVLIDLVDWSEAAVDHFGFVLDRLRAASLWTSSGDRGYAW